MNDPDVLEPSFEVYCVSGLPGAGKSTLVRRLESELGWKCFDLDECVYEMPQDPIELLNALWPSVSPSEREILRPLYLDSAFLQFGYSDSPEFQQLFYNLMGNYCAEHIFSQAQQLSLDVRVGISLLLHVRKIREHVVEDLRAKRLDPVLVDIFAPDEELLRVADERSIQPVIRNGRGPLGREDVKELIRVKSQGKAPSLDEGWKRIVNFTREDLGRLKTEVIEQRILGD